MGVALAEEARRRGAEVTLLAANLAVPVPAGIELVETPTAASVAEAALSRQGADVVVMAAAIADYRPLDAREDKRAKDGDPWTVKLEPTTDVLAELGRLRTNGQVLVGFAADQGADGLERAREKLVRKAVDLVVFNDVAQEGIGFDATDNEVVLISADGERAVARAPKAKIASAILDAIEELLA
jgi:phosphopantothenoylcysteine decarboxylase/phosphopantothenate--cysteine ligase